MVASNAALSAATRSSGTPAGPDEIVNLDLASTNGAGPINDQIFDYGMDPDIVESEEFGQLVERALVDIPSISLVTKGTAPQRRQIRKIAVSVPNLYSVVISGSLTLPRSTPAGCEVYAPPCLTQKLQAHTRTGNGSDNSGLENSNDRLPQ